MVVHRFVRIAPAKEAQTPGDDPGCVLRVAPPLHPLRMPVRRSGRGALGARRIVAAAVLTQPSAARAGLPLDVLEVRPLESPLFRLLEGVVHGDVPGFLIEVKDEELHALGILSLRDPKF